MISATNGVHAERLHNEDLEASILGGVIKRNELLAQLPDLEIDDFADHRHKVVWQAIRNLEAKGRPIDVVTVELEIERTDRELDIDKLTTIGGIAFLGDLTMRCPTADNVLVYAGIVRSYAYTRELAKVLTENASRVVRGAAETDELDADLDRKLVELRERYADVRTASSPKSGSANADRFGTPFVEFVGDEPDDNAADVFEAHGLLVRGEPSLFIGEPKVGKTFVLEDLMLHVAAGRASWCGVPIYRRARVLLFLREDSVRTTRRRLHQLARGAGIAHDELAGWLDIDATSRLYLDDEKLARKLEQQLTRYDVCAIDSLSTIHNADENSVERMAPIMNRWRDTALGTHTALPIVHHFRKAGETPGGGGGGILKRARGSSIIGATTRHAVGVERGPEPHQIVLSVESNHEIDTEPFVIRRRFATDELGRKSVTHERVGSLREAAEATLIARVDPVVLAVIREAGQDGIKATKLRKAVISQLKEDGGAGVRGIKVDEAAKRLDCAGKVEQRVDKAWRVRTGAIS